MELHHQLNLVCWSARILWPTLPHSSKWTRFNFASWTCTERETARTSIKSWNIARWIVAGGNVSTCLTSRNVVFKWNLSTKKIAGRNEDWPSFRQSSVSPSRPSFWTKQVLWSTFTRFQHSVCCVEQSSNSIILKNQGWIRSGDSRRYRNGPGTAH